MMNPVPYQGVEMFRTLLPPLLALLVVACSSTPEPPPPARQASAFDGFYQQWRGVPYRMGGTNRAGLDCSAHGFVGGKLQANMKLLRLDPVATKGLLENGTGSRSALAHDPFGGDDFCRL